MKQSGDGTELLTTPEAGLYIGMSAPWLILGRRFGFGPEFIREGKGKGRIFYTRAALDVYLAKKVEA